MPTCAIADLATTGAECSFADPSSGPVAVAVADGVFLEAERLAPLRVDPIDVAVVAILEELMPALVNTRDKVIAKSVVAYLFGGLTVVNGKYVPS